MNVIDALIKRPPFVTPVEDKNGLLLEALQLAYRHHYDSCDGYRRFCDRRSLGPQTVFTRIEDLPYLPVQAFKRFSDQLTSVNAGDVKTRLQSSATSGVPSTILVDAITAKRQVRALVSVLSASLGSTRRPFLIMDVDPRGSASAAVGARSAAVKGFLNLAREAHYFIEDHSGALSFTRERFEEALSSSIERDEPLVVFGFTYVLYSTVVLPLLEAGLSFDLPRGSKVAHIGGWKKLEDSKVDKEQFNDAMSRAFNVGVGDVIDYYGFTEQMGVTYPDGADGLKCTPVFSDIVVRDPVSFEPLADGNEGLLEFVTPMPHSYPGIAVLTDDLGVIERRGTNADGWNGTLFRVTGRAKNAEVRGCGDIMASRVAAAPAPGSISDESYVLKDDTAFYTSNRVLDPLDPTRLPKADDLDALADALSDNRAVLDSYSTDELILLISEAASRWLDPSSGLMPLQQHGLVFLANWCRSDRLREMARQSLRNRAAALDVWLTVDDTGARLTRAVPRGLVCHWLAGNVPLLGMLGLVQSVLTKNANLLKVASTFSSVMPVLLRSFEGLELRSPSGRTLKGDDILSTIAVVFYPKTNTSAARRMSAKADARVAWGGREAVESILNLEKQIHTEDLVFGPKHSFMVIAREALSTARQVKKVARRAATDISVFDQYACASPHTIFVEKGATASSPREFAEALSAEMSVALDRIPKAPADAGTVGNISSERMRYELFGELWTSDGSEWTVLFDDEPRLEAPTYSRVVYVKPVEDIMDCARFASKEIQTVGLAMPMHRRMEFGDVAARLGCERFPEVGRMTHFDSPWDGLYMMDRLVRWVSLGGPY